MTPGAFGGNERMTLDSGAARPFYGALFGWETEDYPSEGINYVMVKLGDSERLLIDPQGTARPRALSGRRDRRWAA